MKDKKKTKRYGTLNSAVSNVMSKDTPVKAPDTSKIDVGSTPKLKTEPTSFAEAFRAERKEKGSGSTFSWKGKSYSTNMASDKSTPTVRKTPSAAPKTNAPKADAPKPSTPDFSKAKIPAMLKASDKGAPSASSDFSKARVPSMLKPSGSSAPAKKRPFFGEDGIIAGYDSAATAAKKDAEGKAKDKAGNPFYRSYRDKAGGMAKGGSTEYPIRIDLDKAKRDTAARDAKAAAKRTPREEAEKKAMEKKYPFNKYASGGGVTKQMPSAKGMGSMGMAKGGGAERKGKTSTKMVKMAKGGSIDGIAQRGKTRCKGMS